MAFDRTKPYGTISGDAFNRVYDQGGKQYDAAGNEVVVTNAMRAEQIAREAEAAASTGDDKDAVIAALTRQLANQAAKDEGVDLRDLKIAELKKKAASAAKPEQKPADPVATALDEQISKQ